MKKFSMYLFTFCLVLAVTLCGCGGGGGGKKDAGPSSGALSNCTYVGPGVTATIIGNALTLNIDTDDEDASVLKVTFQKETGSDYENVYQTDTFWEGNKYLKFVIVDRVAMVIQPYKTDGSLLNNAFMLFCQKTYNQSEYINKTYNHFVIDPNYKDIRFGCMKIDTDFKGEGVNWEADPNWGPSNWGPSSPNNATFIYGTTVGVLGMKVTEDGGDILHHIFLPQSSTSSYQSIYNGTYLLYMSHAEDEDKDGEDDKFIFEMTLENGKCTVTSLVDVNNEFNRTVVPFVGLTSETNAANIRAFRDAIQNALGTGGNGTFVFNNDGFLSIDPTGKFMVATSYDPNGNKYRSYAFGIKVVKK